MTDPKIMPQIKDTAFLERRFGMTPRQAAELMARKTVDVAPDSDKERLKPMPHTKNDRVGGG